jgi:hypothetical protein
VESYVQKKMSTIVHTAVQVDIDLFRKAPSQHSSVIIVIRPFFDRKVRSARICGQTEIYYPPPSRVDVVFQNMLLTEVEPLKLLTHATRRLLLQMTGEKGIAVRNAKL